MALNKVKSYLFNGSNPSKCAVSVGRMNTMLLHPHTSQESGREVRLKLLLLAFQ